MIGSSWSEIELGFFSNPRNSEPIDEMVMGIWILLLEVTVKIESYCLRTRTRRILLFGACNRRVWPSTNGFNMEFIDLNDGRLDIVGAAADIILVRATR